MCWNGSTPRGLGAAGVLSNFGWCVMSVLKSGSVRAHANTQNVVCLIYFIDIIYINTYNQYTHIYILIYLS